MIVKVLLPLKGFIKFFSDMECGFLFKGFHQVQKIGFRIAALQDQVQVIRHEDIRQVFEIVIIDPGFKQFKTAGNNFIIKKKLMPVLAAQCKCRGGKSRV
jgi:hypothetical protein